MVDLKGEVLVLSGGPGSGKTTTAGLLAREGGCAKVHLHCDDFWGYIKAGFVEPWLMESQRQNEVVMEVIARAAEGYARGGYFVVADGYVGPWFLGAFRELVGRGVRVHYVVLRGPAEVGVERCRVRALAKREALADAGVIKDLHRQLGDLGEWERCVVSLSGDESAGEVAGLVRRAVEGGRCLLER